MSDDLAEFLFSNMKPNLRRRSRGLGSPWGNDALYTGAVISNTKLRVATVRPDRRGDLQLLAQASFALNLEGRETKHARDFLGQATSVFKRFGIDDVALRVSAIAGKYPGSPLAYKIEGLLQLINTVSVTIVDTAKVRHWVQKTDEALPATDSSLNYAETQLQRSAIETACFACRGPSDREWR